MIAGLNVKNNFNVRIKCRDVMFIKIVFRFKSQLVDASLQQRIFL